MEKRLEVDIQLIVHATEDLEKILATFKETFDIDREDFDMQNLTGHFENPIIMLHAKIKKKKAQFFVKKLVASIPKEQINTIIEDLENRYDDSTLYLRIGKQSLVKGEIVLSDREPVKIKIFTPIYKQADIEDTFTRLLTQGTI
ncbi:RNA-binding domain-containing protein [Candidatus Nitrosotenuis sp. DW1]|uniref:RNA-binding domain-containing protein n=1 Tax=Candidatus Nitrosotenuis sp. DW1 TaxID=2259672 RepID=UPI0015CBA136|nr:RNA-binding domain-containing protein [Candidatus Nitrosotenuis sp. DW1]QLH09511.1 exosome protein [Candidatus Nitrosotenuis sp. DW1]